MLFLIGGVPRSGTTLLIDWLREAWPGDKIWLKESGLTHLAYHTYRLYDFNAKNHPTGINFSLHGAQREEALRALQAWIITLYQIKSGNQTAHWILDKLPVFFQGGERYYQAMLDTFPEVRLVLMIRDAREVISSMRKRMWARGPFPKLNYMSPFIEDAIAANYIDRHLCDSESHGAQPVSYLSEPGSWSFRKCCRNYAHAIRSVAKTVALHPDCLVVDYQDLANPTLIRNTLASYTDVQLGTPFTFKHLRKDRAFTKEEEHIMIEELELTGIHQMYQQLRIRSLDGLKRNAGYRKE